jgi:hypothetical protein
MQGILPIDIILKQFQEKTVYFGISQRESDDQ